MIIDVSFRIMGNEIPLDHGYALYSALSRQFPELHGADWLAVHRITGVPANGRVLCLTRDSRLQFRIPSERLPTLLPLAGRRLIITDVQREFALRLGVPEVYALKAAPALFSTCVVIKVSAADKEDRHPDREMYLTAAQAKLEQDGISGDLWIDDRRDAKGREISRRSLRIKQQIVIGYALHVSNLNDADSLKLQETGIGGRRRLGAGIFVPDRSERAK